MQVIPRLSLVVVLLAGAAVPAAQEPREPPDAPLITGQVIDERSATPLRRVRVSPSSRGAEPVYTDEEGRFRVRSNSSLRLSKPGFVPLTVSREDLEEGTDRLTIRLVRGAAITGVVFDASGFPAPNERVRVRRVEDESRAGRGEQYAVETDDRGEFRVGNLPAGIYEVDAGEGARARGRGRGGRGGRGGRANALALPPPEGVTVTARTGEEASVALVLEPVLETPTAAPPAPARRRTGAGANEEPGSIVGRVVGPDGAPIERASVQALPQFDGGGRPLSATSDIEGRYQFEGLAPGTYRVRVSRAGFTTVEYGQSRALQEGRILRVRPGVRVNGIDVTLPRGSVVTGRVTDAWGEPLEDVRVQAMQLQYQDGRFRLSPASGAPNRETDDRGHYRLSGLLPGTYYIVASQQADGRRGEDATSTDVFYPGTPRLTDALPVELDAGRDALGLDLVFASTAGVRISGTAVSVSGTPVRGRAVLGVSARYGAPLLPIRTAGLDAEGAFEFEDIPQGDYVLQVIGASTTPVPAGAIQPGRAARGNRGGARGRGGRGATQNVDVVTFRMDREFGAQYVSLGGQDMTDLRVDTSPGSTLRGQLVMEGDTGSVQPSSFVLASVPSDPDLRPLTGGNPPRAEVSQDGTFQMTGLTGPSRFVLTRAPAGWWLESVEVGGVNAALHPALFGRPEHSTDGVRAVVSTGAGRIDGRVTDDRNTPASEFAVIVFSTDPDRWFHGSPYVVFAGGAQDGTFSVPSLPPGDYTAIAVDRIAGGAGGGDWQRPDVLSTLAPLGQRVEVGTSQPVTTTLRLVRIGS